MQEDSWIFEDPVSDSIAPGYSEVIDTPMDYSTVEKRIESNQYQDKDQVGGGRGVYFALAVVASETHLSGFV